jgi:hypothetical protein
MRAWRVLIGVAVAGVMLFATAASAGAVEHAAHPTTVIGAKRFDAPYGAGWGHAHPHELFNGGDPSGLISHITWKHWGAHRAYGRGRNAIFRPKGGYYPGTVRIELRAQGLGHCGSHRAYTRLFAREPRKPGGKLGKWYSWTAPGHNLCSS